MKNILIPIEILSVDIAPVAKIIIAMKLANYTDFDICKILKLSKSRFLHIKGECKKNAEISDFLQKNAIFGKEKKEKEKKENFPLLYPPYKEKKEKEKKEKYKFLTYADFFNFFQKDTETFLSFQKFFDYQLITDNLESFCNENEFVNHSEPREYKFILKHFFYYLKKIKYGKSNSFVQKTGNGNRELHCELEKIADRVLAR